MNTPAASPSTVKPFYGWVAPLALAAVLACIGLLVSFSSQRSLLARGPGGFSAATLFNQANADTRGGKTAQAIVGYERAQFLAPRDASVSTNLNVIRTRAGLPATMPSGWQRIVSWASPNTMAWLGSLGLIFAGAGWAFARSSAGARPVLVAAGVCGAALVALAITSAVVSWQISREAVVLTKDAPARISPTTVSEVSFKLPAGEIATMLGQHGDFVLVGDASGHTGWVSERDLQPIVPAAHTGPL